MDSLQFFLFKLLAFFIIVSECYSAQQPLQDQKYFKKVTNHGEYMIQLYIGRVLVCGKVITIQCVSGQKN